MIVSMLCCRAKYYVAFTLGKSIITSAVSRIHIPPFFFFCVFNNNFVNYRYMILTNDMYMNIEMWVQKKEEKNII